MPSALNEIEPGWEELRYFRAIALAGALGPAARRLGVSEATVSRHLRALEARLGARLFDRLPNRLALTALGDRVLLAAERMAENAADFARLARSAAAEEAAPLRLTTTGSVALFLTRHLGGLLEAVPGCQLQLIGTREALSLTKGEADIALRMRRPPESGPLAVRRIGRIGFSLYAHADLLARAEPVSVIGLSDAPESRQASWQQAFLAAEAATGKVAATSRLRLDEVPQRLEAVQQKLGAALLPCFLGAGDPALRPVCPPPPELQEDIFLMVHEDMKERPAVAACLTALAALFRREAESLTGSQA
ncbi:LysR family transcriptional regulator [Radicibacter daui]|uniref:LysR family transcriptional regulator n=1 Tax=Radicibacter daui TaxID=3064829 RepID=UPI004046C16D